MKKLKAQLNKLKKRAEHQSLLITALYLWLLFAVYEIIVRVYDLYQTAPVVDIPGHFLAGVAMAATFFWLSHDWKHKNYIAVIGTIILSILWEAGEKLQEFVFYNPPHLLDFFIWDGVWDIIIATIGALTFVILRTFRTK